MNLNQQIEQLKDFRQSLYDVFTTSADGLGHRFAHALNILFFLSLN